MSYPEIIVFKDSSVLYWIMAIFFYVLISFGLFQIDFQKETIPWVGLTLIIFLALFCTVMILRPTRSTLSPDGIRIKAVGGSVEHKWNEISDLRIYDLHGYLGFGRRFVTFQDPTKRLQKYVFLVPINIWSKPEEILEIVKMYRQAALNDLATE